MGEQLESYTVTHPTAWGGRVWIGYGQGVHARANYTPPDVDSLPMVFCERCGDLWFTGEQQRPWKCPLCRMG
jgi:hypothetical protein